MKKMVKYFDLKLKNRHPKKYIKHQKTMKFQKIKCIIYLHKKKNPPSVHLIYTKSSILNSIFYIGFKMVICVGFGLLMRAERCSKKNLVKRENIPIDASGKSGSN